MPRLLTHISIAVVQELLGNVEAHPGNTDRLGGHFRRANCTYHFHHPTSLIKGKTHSQIVNMIKTYNSNKVCTRQLTESKVEWSSL